MNRRNLLKTAIGAIAAACGWKANPWPGKRPDIVTMTPSGVEPPDDFDCKCNPIYFGVDSAPVDLDDYTMVTVYFNGQKVSEKPVKMIKSRILSVDDVQRWYRIPSGVI